MPPMVMTRSAGRPAATPRGGGTGGRVGRGGRRVREHRKRNVESTGEPEGQENDQGVEVNEGMDGVPNFSTIIAQQLQNLLPTIVAQVGSQGSNQGNGRNQNGDAINDNIRGEFRNVIENNDRRGCTYKEFLACNPKDNYRTNTLYLKTLKNSRPLPDFEEYAIDTPYMILWSKIKKNTFSANAPYPKTPILRIGQYSVSKKSDMVYWSIRRIKKSDMTLLNAVRITAAQVYVNTALMKMRIEQYIQMIDYALWEVIENDATLPKTKTVEGVMTEMPITTAEEKAQRRLEGKARKKRFGGNAATKKTQRNLLKQQYENFTAPSSEMLDQTFDRIQKLVS
ncbi:hypothetical protein Tco_0014131 [Tanacetum coccineum]